MCEAYNSFSSKRAQPAYLTVLPVSVSSLKRVYDHVHKILPPFSIHTPIAHEICNQPSLFNLISSSHSSYIIIRYVFLKLQQHQNPFWFTTKMVEVEQLVHFKPYADTRSVWHCLQKRETCISVFCGRNTVVRVLRSQADLETRLSVLCVCFCMLFVAGCYKLNNYSKSHSHGISTVTDKHLEHGTGMWDWTGQIKLL